MLGIQVWGWNAGEKNTCSQQKKWYMTGQTHFVCKKLIGKGRKIERKKKYIKKTIKRIIVMFRRKKGHRQNVHLTKEDVWGVCLTTLTHHACDQAHTFASSWQTWQEVHRLVV